MKHIDCGLGLHRLDRQFQKKYMADQCEELLAGLDNAIEATRIAAKIRRNPYAISRVGRRRQPALPESQLEEAMWRKWHRRYDSDAVPGAWYRIVTYQMMLRDSNDNSPGWGEVDLVGVSFQGLPVVIEIKSHNNRETPLRMLVEAAAYGVAIRSVWSALGKQWKEVIPQLYGLELAEPSTLSNCPLVCAAHHSYWNEWIGDTPRARNVPPTLWKSFGKLVGAFAERGFPTSFVSLDYRLNARDESGLPHNISAQLLDPFTV